MSHLERQQPPIVNSSTPIVLASSSPSRKLLMDRLMIDYVAQHPNIDETPLENETPEALVKRLALEKAQVIANNYLDAIVIGSDQVAIFDNKVFGKPHTHEKALEQLCLTRGKTVNFLTGLCVINCLNKQSQVITEPFYVTFKDLPVEKIDQYLKKEQPYQCAGSIRSEGLAVAIIEKFEGEDPSALMGLPLIKLVNLLEKTGYSVL